MDKKIAFLSIDLEEWFNLDYLKEYEVDKNEVKVIPDIFTFLDLLDGLNIKASFFCLAELVESYGDIILDIESRGHEICCHGFDHELLYNKSLDKFKEDLKKSKMTFGNLFGRDIIRGYRASCFSMDNEKLDILYEQGFTYDSSYIDFNQHPLYGKLDMKSFSLVQKGVYVRNGFYEFQISTMRLLRFNIPVTSGGYMRLFPWLLIKKLLKKHYSHDSIVNIYLHPFELTSRELSLKKYGIPFIKRFRASVGRKKNVNKMNKLLTYLLENNVKFYRFSDYIEEVNLQ